MASRAAKSPPGLKIDQIAIVVKDLRKTMERYHEIMGWGPWRVYDYKPPFLFDTRLRGKSVGYAMLGAEVHCDPVDFEIIQPLEGPSIYREFLEEKGEGLHHVSVIDPERKVRKALDDFRANGIEALMSGKVHGAEFYYMDTDPILKMVAETVTGHAISLEPSYTYP